MFLPFQLLLHLRVLLTRLDMRGCCYSHAPVLNHLPGNHCGDGSATSQGEEGNCSCGWERLRHCVQECDGRQARTCQSACISSKSSRCVFVHGQGSVSFAQGECNVVCVWSISSAKLAITTRDNYKLVKLRRHLEVTFR